MIPMFTHLFFMFFIFIRSPGYPKDSPGYPPGPLGDSHVYHPILGLSSGYPGDLNKLKNKKHNKFKKFKTLTNLNLNRKNLNKWQKPLLACRVSPGAGFKHFLFCFFFFIWFSKLVRFFVCVLFCFLCFCVWFICFWIFMFFRLFRF